MNITSVDNIPSRIKLDMANFKLVLTLHSILKRKEEETYKFHIIRKIKSFVNMTFTKRVRDQRVKI